MGEKSSRLKVACYRSSSIGDVVLATACLDLLAQLGSDIEVIWLGRAPSIDIIRAYYPDVSCIELPNQTEAGRIPSELIKNLADCDVFVDLQTSIKSRLLARALKNQYNTPGVTCRKHSLSRAAMVVRARLGGRGVQMPAEYKMVSRFQYQLMADTLVDGLRSLLDDERHEVLVSYEPHPKLPKIQVDEPMLNELKFGTWLAVAPGATYDSKRAPAALIEQILVNLKHISNWAKLPQIETGLVFLGSEKERDLCTEVANAVRWPHQILNLAGRYTLVESSCALGFCSALLANDSALTHIAEAQGVPVSVMFGPTVERFGFMPWKAESRAFSAELGCRPCSKHGRASCRYGDKKCFDSIDPEVVARRLYHQLSGSS